MDLNRIFRVIKETTKEEPVDDDLKELIKEGKKLLEESYRFIKELEPEH